MLHNYINYCNHNCLSSHYNVCIDKGKYCTFRWTSGTCGLVDLANPVANRAILKS